MSIHLAGALVRYRTQPRQKKKKKKTQMVPLFGLSPFSTFCSSRSVDRENRHHRLAPSETAEDHCLQMPTVCVSLFLANSRPIPLAA